MAFFAGSFLSFYPLITSSISLQHEIVQCLTKGVTTQATEWSLYNKPSWFSAHLCILSIEVFPGLCLTALLARFSLPVKVALCSECLFLSLYSISSASDEVLPLSHATFPVLRSSFFWPILFLSYDATSQLSGTLISLPSTAVIVTSIIVSNMKDHVILMLTTVV